jgi:hypothetical protein
VYNKENVLGLYEFLLDKCPICKSIGEVWSNFKAEYYNREVKRVKLRVRKACNRRKSGQQYREDLKRLSKQLLLAKKNAQKSFLRFELKLNWTEFYEYVKRRKGEDIAVVKDSSGRLTAVSIEKANSLYFYCSWVFKSEGSIPQIQCANSCEPFANSSYSNH